MAQHNHQMGSLQKTIQTAVDAAFSNFQPQLNESVNELAERAIDATQETAKKVVRSARSNPWYLIGGAAAILLLAGAFMAFQDNSIEDYVS